MRRSEGRGNPVSAVLAQSSAPGGSRAPPGGRRVEDGVRAGASHTARPTAAPALAPHAGPPRQLPRPSLDRGLLAVLLPQKFL